MGFAVCPTCAVGGAQQSLGEHPVSPRTHPVPFEDPARARSPVSAFLDTMKMVLIAPAELYSRVVFSKAVLKPALFGYICTLAGMLGTLAWYMLLDLPGQELIDKAAADAGTTSRMVLFGFTLLAPFLAAIQLALEVAVFHGVARMVGGRGSLTKSFQMYSYSSAAHVLKVVPYIGSFLYWMARVFTQYTGTRIVHRLGAGRAALAVAIPILLSLVLGFGGMM